MFRKMNSGLIYGTSMNFMYFYENDTLEMEILCDNMMYKSCYGPHSLQGPMKLSHLIQILPEIYENNLKTTVNIFEGKNITLNIHNQMLNKSFGKIELKFIYVDSSVKDIEEKILEFENSLHHGFLCKKCERLVHVSLVRQCRECKREVCIDCVNRCHKAAQLQITIHGTKIITSTQNQFKEEMIGGYLQSGHKILYARDDLLLLDKNYPMPHIPQLQGYKRASERIQAELRQAEQAAREVNQVVYF